VKPLASRNCNSQSRERNRKPPPPLPPNGERVRVRCFTREAERCCVVRAKAQEVPRTTTRARAASSQAGGRRGTGTYAVWGSNTPVRSSATCCKYVQSLLYPSIVRLQCCSGADCSASSPETANGAPLARGDSL